MYELDSHPRSILAIEAKNKRRGSNGGGVAECKSSLVDINFGERLVFIEPNLVTMREEDDTEEKESDELKVWNWKALRHGRNLAVDDYWENEIKVRPSDLTRREAGIERSNAVWIPENRPNL